MAQATQTRCTNRTYKGNCGCAPKCEECGHGPHAAIHLGCADDPARAFGHAYAPRKVHAADYYANRITAHLGGENNG